VTIHLSILLVFPLVLGLIAAFAPSGWAGVTLLIGTLVSLAYAILLLFDFDTGRWYSYRRGLATLKP